MARRPSPGNLSDPYGWRVHPIWGDQQFHYGRDIGWSNGRTLVAPSNGTIVAYGWQGGWGKRLDFLGDDGVLHYLAHTADIWVAVGTHVAEGTPIAEMGETGDVTAVHLHWETRPGGGSTINPETWLRDATPTPTDGGKAPAQRRKKDSIMVEAAYRTPGGTIAVQARLGGALTLLDDPHEWTGIAAATGAGTHAVSEEHLAALRARYGTVPTSVYDTGREPLCILIPESGKADRFGALGTRAWPLENTGELAALQRQGATIREVTDLDLKRLLEWKSF